MSVINGWVEFYNLLIENENNIFEYVILSFSMIAFYYWIFRKQIKSIFDPFVYMLFTSATAACVPVFMYIHGLLYLDEFFWDFILTEIAFILGLVMFSKISFANIKLFKYKIDLNRTLEKNIYYFMLIFYILTQLSSFFLYGVPILSDESRLSYYSDGTGILISIANFLMLPALMLGIDRWMHLDVSIGEKILNVFFILNVILGLLAGGSKSAGLVIVYGIFFYYQYLGLVGNKKRKILGKILVGFFCVAVAMGFVVLSIQTQGDFEIVGLSMLHRIVASGNCFGYFYGDDLRYTIQLQDNIFLEIFQQPLKVLRIIPYDSAVSSIGYQLEYILFHSLVLGGPNARHNIVGILYLGLYGGILYSFLLGGLISIIRNIMLVSYRSNIIVYIFMCYIYFLAITFPTDIGESMNGIFRFMVVNTSVIIFSYVITKIFRKVGRGRC